MKLVENNDVSNINISKEKDGYGFYYIQIRPLSKSEFNGTKDRIVAISTFEPDGQSDKKTIEVRSSIEIPAAIAILNELELPFERMDTFDGIACGDNEISVSVYYYGIDGNDYKCYLSYEDATKLFDKLSETFGTEVFDEFYKLVKA